MQETYTNKHANDYDDEIDLQELFNVLWSGKVIIVSLTAFISILGVIYSLFLPNIYEAKSLLNSTSQSSSLSGSLQSYSGLAGLAGLNLPSTSNSDNSAKALEKLNSLSFFENNILPNIFLPNLMALKSWDFESNEINYDQSIYDSKSNNWVRDKSNSLQRVPSAQESFEVFINTNMHINVDQKSKFVSLSIKHQSPKVAKEWVELIVKEINSFYRNKDKSESEKAINYLSKQIELTTISEVRQAISSLLQEETKKLALIEANDFYVFEYIDPPAIMEKKSEPNRVLICIFIGLFGGIISIFYVLIRHYALKKGS